ncbi:hypothetical protein SDC9_138023 [bioreactor metagenome]|uniref:Uncharacterized protein n=1 Tax=bioreactor metagenome TaxID=1076179 RepID=A0A645DN64_9ZZZZ
MGERLFADPFPLILHFDGYLLPIFFVPFHDKVDAGAFVAVLDGVGKEVVEYLVEVVGYEIDFNLRFIAEKV